MRTHHHQRASARARILLTGLVVVGIAGLALTGTGATSAVAAAPSQTTFVDEGFTGASAGTGYIRPSTQSGATNVACLTAAGANTGTVPTCAGASDAEGSGALRLTTATNNQTGGVGAKQSVPITKGIDALFDSYQYNGAENGYGGTADGIVFYLAATDPYNPSVPQQIGYLGGSLGYSASANQGGTGLSNGYLGIGIDRYGNFVNPEFGGTGCSGDKSTARTPNSVTVRGPGNGTAGYCVVSTTAGTGLAGGGKLSQTGVTNRSQARVPVEIVINPTTSTITAQRATTTTVAPGKYAVIFTSIGGREQVLTGDLPNLKTSNPGGIASSWIDPATGYPYKLTYGWVAGTGGANDVHEVNYLKTTTAAGPVPVLTATTGGSSSVAHAGSGTYTVTPTVSADGGSESQKIRTTTTFPAGVTPDVTGMTDLGDGWTCTVSGQVATCDQAVDAAAPIAAGTQLPTLSIPYTVSGAARTATVSTVVASTDAETVTVTGAVVVSKQTTAITASDATATVGTTATLNATVSSTSASSTTPTGSVVFRDAETSEVLCTSTIVSGTATCDVPAAAVGSKGFVVSYAGDADHAAAADASAALTVTKIPTAIEIAATPSPTTYGSPATLSVSGLPSAATGTVEFREGSTVLCTATLPTTSCTAPAGLSAGTHTLVAVYSGDDTHEGATAATVELTVQKATATIGTPGADPSGPGTTPTDPSDPSAPSGPADPDTTVTVTHGQPVTLDTDGVPTDATGTIDYVTDDGTVLCTATLPETTCTIPDGLPGGKYTVHAEYSGDDNYEPSSGAPFELVVAPEKTAVVASTDEPRPTVGTRIRLTASGLPAGATGSVAFTAADGTVLCTTTLPATSCTTDALPVGASTVTVSYGGDESYAASTTTLDIEVLAAPGADPEPSATPTPSATPSATPAASASGELAFTGAPIAMASGAALALALLIAGLVLLAARRRAARSTQD